jgi:hypothetical protein
MRIQELANRADDEPLLLVGELGVKRQRNGLTRGGFGVGKITRRVTQRREARLQVERDGVVDLGADLARREIVAQRVADRSWNAASNKVR